MDSPKFQNLKFKIFGKSDDEVSDILKPLHRYAAVKKLASHAREVYLTTMKYLIYLYDPGTDLNREFVRLEDRRTEAAKIAGLNTITDLKIYDGIFSSSAPDVLDVIQVLLTEVYHDIDYREWVLLHKELDENNAARWEKAPTTKKVTKASTQNKAVLREENKRIRELIEELTQKIFGDHVEIKTTAYKSRFKNPESFSRAAKQNV